jgi:hypothetical protein
VSEVARAEPGDVVTDGWATKLRRTVFAVPPSGTGDSVFVLGDVAPDVQAQYDRLWSLIKRGKRVLIIAAGVMFVTLLIATTRGGTGASSWLLPPGALLVAVVCELIDRRLAAHPPGAVEVPTDLGDLIAEMYQIRDEISIYGPDRMLPLKYERTVQVVGDNVSAIVARAAAVLTAERSPDTAAVATLRADIERRLEVVMDIYESLDMDNDEDEDDEADDEPATRAAARGARSRRDPGPEETREQEIS